MRVELTPLQYDVLQFLHTGELPAVPTTSKRWENALDALRCKGLIFLNGKDYTVSLKGERVATTQNRPATRERV